KTNVKEDKESKYLTVKEIQSKLIGDINTHYKNPVAMFADEVELEKIETGIFSFDIETGGGVPRGRGIIVSGEESTFKSSFIYLIGGRFQRICGNCNKGKITEVNFKKTRIEFNNDKKNENVELKTDEYGEKYYIAKKFFATSNKKNKYSPGQRVIIKEGLALYSYELECSHCANPDYSLYVLFVNEHNYTDSWARKMGVVSHY